MPEGVEPTTKTLRKSSASCPCFKISEPPPFLYSDLLFVEVRTVTKKVHKKDVRTAIRKHVRREIDPGKYKATRKAKKLGVLVPPLGNHDENYGSFPDANSATHSLAAGIPRGLIGGGRLNPFISYPIRMSREDLFLVDYG
jgi:hypothetical protein